MFEDVLFGGLYALVAPEKVPIKLALRADNCYLDDGTIYGRNGYRCLLSTSNVPTAVVVTADGSPTTVTTTTDGTAYTEPPSSFSSFGTGTPIMGGGGYTMGTGEA